MHTRTHTHMHCTHACTHAQMHKRMHARTHARMHARTPRDTHVHTHTHTHMYVIRLYRFQQLPQFAVLYFSTTLARKCCLTTKLNVISVLIMTNKFFLSFVQNHAIIIPQNFKLYTVVKTKLYSEKGRIH